MDLKGGQIQLLFESDCLFGYSRQMGFHVSIYLPESTITL